MNRIPLSIRLHLFKPAILIVLIIGLTLLWDWAEPVFNQNFVPQINAVSGMFFSWQNLTNILRENAEKGIIAIAMTFVILIGGIDLSVGSVLALANMACAWIIVRMGGVAAGTGGVLASVAVALLVSAFIGAFNGLGTTRLKIQSFIVTLGSMSIARGLALYLNDGRIIEVPGNSLPPVMKWLYSDIPIGGGLAFPVPSILFFALVALSGFVLTRTVFGRHLYAIGGNREAAKLAGIRVERREFCVYLIASVLCGVSGILHTSKIAIGAPNDGIGFELDAIAMVVMGGTRLTGGLGGITGTVFGFFTIAIINNVLLLRTVNSNIQRIIMGLIIIAAVMLQKREGTK